MSSWRYFFHIEVSSVCNHSSNDRYIRIKAQALLDQLSKCSDACYSPFKHLIVVWPVKCIEVSGLSLICMFSKLSVELQIRADYCNLESEDITPSNHQYIVSLTKISQLFGLITLNFIHCLLCNRGESFHWTLPQGCIYFREFNPLLFADFSVPRTTAGWECC